MNSRRPIVSRTDEELAATSHESIDLHLVYPIPTDLSQLKDQVMSYQDKTGHRNASNIRGKLAEFTEKFHAECGTLTPQVGDKIDTLRSLNCSFLMTAHQPNLFSYSGVLRKATLVHMLSCELEGKLDTPVVGFFGIADQDFTDDRWVRSSLLPAVHRKGGTLTLQTQLPKERMIKEICRPSREVIFRWKGQTNDWLERTFSLAAKSLGTHKTSEWRQKETVLAENLEGLWEIVEESYERSTSYSNFNAFVMSKIVNEVWGYDTLFARFSECQQILAQEFEFLLSQSREYSNALREAHNLMIKKKGAAAVSETEPELVPFWYHCECGGKSRLHLERSDKSLAGIGSCTGCHKNYTIDLGTEKNPDISHISDRISARAISMTLVFFKGLGVSCYVGGIGGHDYLAEASYVADKLKISFPPIAFWRPHDRYLGIGQLEAILQFKRITGNLDISKWETEVNRLKKRIAGIYSRIDELELEKQKLVKQLKKRDQAQKKYLQERIREISRKQGRMKGETNLSVLNRDLKMLENVPVALDLIPSIIDYAVNIGLKETSEQWIEFLMKDGNLFSDIYIRSVLDDLTPLKPFSSAIADRMSA